MPLAEFYFLRTKRGPMIWVAHYHSREEVLAAARELRRLYGRRVMVVPTRNVMVNFSAQGEVSVCAWPCN